MPVHDSGVEAGGATGLWVRGDADWTRRADQDIELAWLLAVVCDQMRSRGLPGGAETDRGREAGGSESGREDRVVCSLDGLC